jgi:hypothetical protein
VSCDESLKNDCEEYEADKADKPTRTYEEEGPECVVHEKGEQAEKE